MKIKDSSNEVLDLKLACMFLREFILFLGYANDYLPLLNRMEAIERR